MNFNYTPTVETQATPTSPVYDWSGSLGPGPETSLNQGAFKWRYTSNFSYVLDAWRYTLGWRHLPTAKAAQAVIAGAAGSPFLGAEESYDIFDLSIGYALKNTYNFRLGIDNLFDKDPPVATGTGFGGSANGGTNAVFYDTIGRSYKIGLRATF